jgi:uncharacterized coiled-coil DUF342 family protein
MSDKDTADLTIHVLREIREEARKTNARLDETNARLGNLQEEVREGFAALRTEMHVGFEQLGGRIDNLLLGEHRQEHEELRGRVERIEKHLGLRTQ